MTIACCIRCGRERLMEGKGLCVSCHKITHHNKKKAYKAQVKWRKKNRNYWKEYYEKKRVLVKQK